MTDGSVDDGDLMEVVGDAKNDVTTDHDGASPAPNDVSVYTQHDNSFPLTEVDSNSLTDTAETEVPLPAAAHMSISNNDLNSQHDLVDDHRRLSRDSAADEDELEEERRSKSSSVPRCHADDDEVYSSDGGRGRGRRSGARRGNATGGLNGRERDRERSRDGQRHHSGASSNSLSPKWDIRGGGSASPGAGRGGGGPRDDPRVEASPRRRGGGEGGSPRPTEELEPSKVLHVRNVGYPVTQTDLSSLLGCFGQVEKIKMFSGQALVQLPSVSIAKATMRHFEEDEEPRIGNKRIYINFSRSKSIEARDGGEGGGGGGGGGGSINGQDSGRSSSGGRVASTGAAAVDSTGTGPLAQQDSASPYAHLIMEDHAKLLGLATLYLQSYGIPGGEGAVLNINQREEMAEYQRQAMAAAAITLNGNANTSGLGGWNGTAAAAAAATAAAATRLGGNMPSGGYSGFSGRQRGQASEILPERSQQNRRPQR